MSSLPLSSTFFSCRPTFSGAPPHLPTPKTRIHHHPKVSCCKETPQLKFDRRNLLVGMGGMYGAANLLDSSALATPIPGPDFAQCTIGTDLNTGEKLTENCCPPLSQEIKDYKLPWPKKLRVRPAAHLVSKEYIAKYEEAVAMMKALPEDDPRNFIQQAHVHCAYCNNVYPRSPGSNLKLQIHLSWHFYPWHRWYIYFYERILGKLIGDPTFALPFWNWDNLPPAPYMPSMYVDDIESPLNDTYRNPDHLRNALADLRYSPDKPSSDIIPSNMAEMYCEMSRTNTLEDFYGARYVVDTDTKEGKAGSVERGSHTAIHVWAGENTREGYDMGNFATACKDSIFCAHHANVDRLWSVWCDQRPLCKPKGFCDNDWLDANYLFYDENKHLVRVYVKDCLDHEKMGYTFEKVDNPWMKSRPERGTRKSKVYKTKAEAVVFPVKLDKVVKVVVDRPNGKRSQEEKEREEELLVIEGIEADTSKAVRFEVYVNDFDDEPDKLIDKAEYAGCYGHVRQRNGARVKSNIRLGLTELLEDLEVEDEDKILVSLVPKAGGEDITIGGVKIVYVDYLTGKVRFDK